MITKKTVEDHLRAVLDPELGINIVDLGLIYDIKTAGSDVFILMTLTFPGCPLGNIIRDEINEKVGSIPGIVKIDLKITFDPPWDLTKINSEARAELGMI
jgi:metal-sulfur cluster biosynthetic enzyme